MIKSTQRLIDTYLKVNQQALKGTPVSTEDTYKKMTKFSVHLPSWTPSETAKCHSLIVDTRDNGVYKIYVERTTKSNSYTVYFRHLQPHEVQSECQAECCFTGVNQAEYFIRGVGLQPPVYLISYTTYKEDYSKLDSFTMKTDTIDVWTRFHALEDEKGVPKLLVGRRYIVYVVCQESSFLRVYYYIPNACEIPPLRFFEEYSDILVKYSFEATKK